LRLLSPDATARKAAALELQAQAIDPAQLPLIRKALAQERDRDIKAMLEVLQATANLQSPEASLRRAGALGLAGSGNPNLRPLLQALLAKSETGAYTEPDATVREAAAASLREIDGRVRRTELVGQVFYGISLGSVLLLAALGLAVTFGLMGIINMAHGELLMIGAYTTYLCQLLFRTYFPGAVDAYLVAALPAAFLVTGLVGMALERTVIRWLYGRPLETLLATWGISLILMQLVRTIFGAQNVEVANPSWMSGGVTVLGSLVLAYNRIAIIIFAVLVVVAVWLILNKTRLGLFVRAVMQNRRMADCVGVSTGRIDMLTFGLGSGIAGLGGVALSQLGNVGPDLGQSYIVDSFMVVVLGGVGQLAGTVIAALGLGEVNKFLEPLAGAVLAKICILVFIIIFIQRRPQGLFALKGRSVD
jgi:urea transport system permease protein